MNTPDIYIGIQNDFDQRVIDVLIVFTGIRECWIKGFDDYEWEDARSFAEDLAKQLNLPIIDMPENTGVDE